MTVPYFGRRYGPLLFSLFFTEIFSKQRNEEKDFKRTTSNITITSTSTYQPRPRNPSVSTAWLYPLNTGVDKAYLEIGTVLLSLNWWPRAL